MKSDPSVSIVLLAKNESGGLGKTLPGLRELSPDVEILVTDDGSNDDTVGICEREGVKVFSHQYSMGNGASVKTGAGIATGMLLVFTDADGQRRREDVKQRLSGIEEGYDTVVGARNANGHESLQRQLGNAFYNRFSSWMVNHPIDDLASGFRAVKAARFREFLDLLPNCFSYPITVTMAFFRSGYSVNSVPLKVERRLGKSHIRLFRDGLRFLLIIFHITTLY